MCKNKNCIGDSWKCDSEDDCGDNSDETDCTHRKYESARTKCVKSAFLSKVCFISN